MLNDIKNKIRLNNIKKNFDEEYYIKKYPDVAKADIDPWKHFKKYGFYEGRYFNKQDEIERGPSEKKTPKTPPKPKFTDNTKTFLLESLALFDLERRKKEICEKISSGNYKNIRILYVSNTGQQSRPILDPSTRYRCFHPSEVLRQQGAYTAVVSSATFLTSPSYDYDIYIFHRPNNSLSTAIQQLKYMNKILIAEYDDLIFGPPETALSSSIYKNKIRGKEEVIRIFQNNSNIMKEFDNFTVSTANLAKKVLEERNTAHVGIVHNFIPNSILQLSAAHKIRNANKNRKLIMYCSGTLSHNKDFKVVEHLLLEALHQDPHLRLYIFGVLQADEKLLRNSRIFFHPPVDYWNMFEHMQDSAFTIAPLENSTFNDCKSNVKFLESCVAGSTLLATPIEDMQRVREAGIMLPESEKDWRYLFSHLDDIDTQSNISRNYEYLVSNCSQDTFLDEYCSFFSGMEM